MDFFASQELARRKTRQMIVLLVLSVLATVIGVYLVVFAAMHTKQLGSPEGLKTWFDPALFGLVVLGVGVVVGGGSFFKIAQLRSGGSTVASLLGGRQLVPNSGDIHERRLLNVVEEMAIAAGTPVPPVYVLDKEPGINAFAAGFTADDAVIGVNRGTLEQLNRDELQGVIAHEFSHILNGDMRMSLRMIGILHGIQLIALLGFFLLRMMSGTGARYASRSSKDKGNGQVVILAIGVGLLVVGSIGLFFARLIKASVSRQREYLADASAVQFTRNPDGIAGALKMIGAHQWGSRVSAPNAEIASHMYFAHMFGHHMLGLMSTHPPLVERIQRIDRQFDGDFSEYEKLRERRLDRTAEAKQGERARKPPQFPGLGGKGGLLPGMATRFPIDPSILIAGVGLPTEEDVVYSQLLTTNAPDSISAAVRDLFSARCVALAMLLQPPGEVRNRQTALIEQREGASTLQETIKLEPSVKQLSPALRLPMFEILQGTLAGMSQEQFRTYRGTISQLTDADQQTSVFEFFLRHHLIVYLDRRFGTAQPPSVVYRSVEPVIPDVNKILSLLVHTGHRDRAQAEAAFQAAVRPVFGESQTAFQIGELLGAQQLSDALQRLSQSAPAVKKQALSAAAIAITHDRQVTVEEAELFRAIAEALDCPVPPVVATSPQLQPIVDANREIAG